MLRPLRTVAPLSSLLDLEEVKRHLNVDHSDDDELVSAYIDAATAHFDGYSGILGRCLISQTWVQKFHCWPACGMRLAFPDVQSVEIAYFDPQNVSQTLSASTYRLIEGASGSYVEWDQQFASPSIYDRADAISVTMVCGYGTSDTDVPASISIAAKMLVAHLYENREAAGAALSETPFGVMALVSPYRRIGL
ncbi:head-tail connector protein [Rhizobium sp. AAP43]|uniref:head-tail connector protein n=1 Tax=Rhizobium sp. AAP43 TaxID=1523420 RepID=UPI0006B8C728|nr:head-tail connector protein [Rhizobium sp. AAP43]KPF47073.1 hypothetical protein IP76_01870 [Rhizobium sp. AAP43]